MKNRTTTRIKKSVTWILIILIAAVAAALVGSFFIVRAESGQEAEFVFPMANANIEWSGAGYNGIYGGGKDGQR